MTKSELKSFKIIGRCLMKAHSSAPYGSEDKRMTGQAIRSLKTVMESFNGMAEMISDNLVPCDKCAYRDSCNSDGKTKLWKCALKNHDCGADQACLKGAFEKYEDD